MKPNKKKSRRIAVMSVLTDFMENQRMYFSQKLHQLETIRVLLLGDKGVGKTSLTNLLATSLDTPTPVCRTVGESAWTVQVRLHEYPAPLALSPFPFLDAMRPPPPTRLYFVEFYDLNTEMRMSREDRIKFLGHIDGIILVHDLLDVATQDSLHDWLYEPLRQIGKHRHGRLRSILPSRHVPIMVVGTKIDLVDYTPVHHPGSIAYQLKAVEIFVNCRDQECFGDHTCNQLKLRNFLNHVVEFQERYPFLKP